jgi:hypothetical protein
VKNPSFIKIRVSVTVSLSSFTNETAGGTVFGYSKTKKNPFKPFASNISLSNLSSFKPASSNLPLVSGHIDDYCVS